MNVPLLQEIKATILAKPHAFRMDRYSCGTAHCIAGHALVKYGLWIANPEQYGHLQKLSDGRDPWFVASEILGIDDHQANILFIEDFWPEDLFERYAQTYDLRDRAEVAADRIDRFIQSGGAE